MGNHLEAIDEMVSLAGSAIYEMGQRGDWRRTSFPATPCGRFRPGGRPNNGITRQRSHMRLRRDAVADVFAPGWWT